MFRSEERGWEDGDERSRVDSNSVWGRVVDMGKPQGERDEEGGGAGVAFFGWRGRTEGMDDGMDGMRGRPY